MNREAWRGYSPQGHKEWEVTEAILYVHMPLL